MMPGLTKQQIDDMGELVARTMGRKGNIRLIMELCDPEKQPDNIPLIEVKPSTYGKGVFSITSIKEGEYITLYPAHLVIDFKPSRPIRYGTYPEDQDYAIAFHDQLLFQGDKETYGGMCFGHMLNDPCDFVKEFDKATRKTIRLLADKYNLQTMERANCQYTKTKHAIWIQATKDIEPGEELLVPYGVKYWMRNVQHLLPRVK